MSFPSLRLVVIAVWLSMMPEGPSQRDDDKKKERNERPAVPAVVADRYQIKQEIGSGSYSRVHAGVDKVTGEQIAAKFEWHFAEKGNKLLEEAGFCKSVAGGTGMPKIHWSGTQDEYNIMIMDALGPSLDDIFKKAGKRLDFVTVASMGEQIVTRLKYVHSCGILHRDIKPQNFLTGRGEEQRKVYIVDFGLAKAYIDPATGKHISSVKKRKGITGTLRFTTRNLHRGLEPTRRDDLGSVGYMMMYLIKGRLPWQGVSAASKHTKQRRVGRRKEKVSHEELCMGYPLEFLKFLEHCEGLLADAEPDYAYLGSLLNRVVTAYSKTETSGPEPMLVRAANGLKRKAPSEEGGDGKRSKQETAAEEKKDDSYSYYYEDPEESEEEEQSEAGDGQEEEEESSDEESEEEESEDEDPQSAQ